MTIAGPVFPEWYWGPIFLSPFILLGAGFLYLIARRIAPGVPWPARALGAVVGSTGLIVGGLALWQWISFEREAARDARAIDFTVYLPEEYDTRTLEPAVNDALRMLVGTYDVGDRVLSVTQRRAVTAPPTACPAPCTAHDVPFDHELIVRGGTLLEVGYPPGARRDALALIDALRPVEPEDIDFAR
jgi:hypothetical protein